MIRHNVILSLLAIYLTVGQGIEVTLTRLSTLYLPTYGQGGSVSYPMPSVSIEQLAFEPKGKVIYGVGKDIIHIIGASDAMNLASVDYVIVPNLELTDVEVCDDAVFISYRDDSNRQKGGVLVYQRYDPLTKKMELLHDIPMGSLPDMVYPTKDCTLVVAIENEGFIEDGTFYDPPGGVGIVRFPSGIKAAPTVKMLNFTAFDEQFNQLSEKGVRWVFRENNSFSDNIEPEYIAFNADYSTAYIALQENNAIAVVDMATDNITAIHGLGFKKWGELDPSDRDGGINIKNETVYGMYQPDSIQFVRWNNQDYIITANEGDAQEYGAPVNFAEEIRAKNIDPADIASDVSDALKEALKDDAKLGRLTISNVDGKNAEGKFERFYTYGARSFSIWRASDMERVYDSGSELEKKVASFRPDIFNSNTIDNSYLNETVDTRSDNKGPETESLAAGEVEDHLLIFAGNERGSNIAVYSVEKGGLKPTFQTLFTGIPQDNTRTWKEIFDAREMFAIDPEFMHFYSPSDGLADYPVLLVAGSVSGTVSTLKVEVKKPTVKAINANKFGGSCTTDTINTKGTCEDANAVCPATSGRTCGCKSGYTGTQGAGCAVTANKVGGSCTTAGGAVNVKGSCEDPNALCPGAADGTCFCKTGYTGTDGAGCAAHRCPNDWVAFEHSCYAFLDIKVPWTSAKAFCELLGAKMLEVESKAENDFIVAQMSRSRLRYVWMGINDLVREGRWVYNSDGLPLNYSNWHSRHFDNSQKYEGGEDCGELYANGRWNDLWCERYYQRTTPVCEKRAVHG